MVTKHSVMNRIDVESEKNSTSLGVNIFDVSKILTLIFFLLIMRSLVTLIRVSYTIHELK